jgi:hypothetical protein
MKLSIMAILFAAAVVPFSCVEARAQKEQTQPNSATQTNNSNTAAVNRDVNTRSTPPSSGTNNSSINSKRGPISAMPVVVRTGEPSAKEAAAKKDRKSAFDKGSKSSSSERKDVHVAPETPPSADPNAKPMPRDDKEVAAEKADSDAAEKKHLPAHSDESRSSYYNSRR